MKTEIVIDRTMSGLRDILFRELELIVNGKSDPSQTAQISKMSSNLLMSVREEMNMHRFTSIKDTIPELTLVGTTSK